jgi:hypothetical protein
MDTDERLVLTPRNTASGVPVTVLVGTAVATQYLSPADVPLYAVLAGTWEVTFVTTATAVLSARFVAHVVESDGVTVVALLGQTALFPLPVAPTTTTTTLPVALPPAGTFFDVTHRIRLQLVVVNTSGVLQGLTVTVQGDEPSRVLTTAVTISPGSAIPGGTNYSDYLFWNAAGGAWEVGSTRVHIGANAGITAQAVLCVAVGNRAGASSQGAQAVAVGPQAGELTQEPGAVAIGFRAGGTGQGLNSVAVGFGAGFNTQRAGAVAVGNVAGQVTQGLSAVAVGNQAGFATQGQLAVAVGASAGGDLQGAQAVALGAEAAYTNQQPNAVAVGYQAGFTLQGAAAVAVGFQAGLSGQGANAVAIGFSTATVNQAANSVCVGPENVLQGVTGAVVIGNQVTLTTTTDVAPYGAVVLNGTTTPLTIGPLDALVPAGFWVTPIRNVDVSDNLIPLYYNSDTFEVVTFSG